jgi:hypothetical protein
MAPAISSCTWKMSAADRSNDSDQRGRSARTSMSWAVIRSRSPTCARCPPRCGPPQRLGDGRDGQVLPLERERRGTGRHRDVRGPDQHVEQLLGDAVAQVLLILFRAHVRERQDRQGDDHLLRTPGGGRSRAEEPAGAQPDPDGHQQGGEDHGAAAQEGWGRALGHRRWLGGGNADAVGRELQRPGQDQGHGKPRTSRTTIMLMAHSGTPSRGSMMSAAWSTTKAVAA